MEIQVSIGKLDFRTEFEKVDDSQLARTYFYKRRQFAQISGNIRDVAFFK